MQDRLQPVGQQQRIQLIDVGAQCLQIIAAHIEGNAQWIELVAPCHLALDGIGVFPGEIGFRGITHRRTFDLGDVVTREILRPGRQGHHHHGVLGEPVKQREDVITGLALRGHVPHLRGSAQALDSDERMRQVIEPPGGRWVIRAWHGECQSLGKVMTKRQVLITGIGSDLQQLVGIAVGNLGFWIEPLEQPRVEILSCCASRADPGRVQ